MKKIKIDITFDDATQLLTLLESLRNKEISYKVIQAEGPGGNWPEFELSGEDDVLRAAINELTGDDEYYDEFIEAVDDVITIAYELWVGAEEELGQHPFALFSELTKLGVTYTLVENDGAGAPPYNARLTGTHKILKDWILKTEYIDNPAEFESLIIKK